MGTKEHMDRLVQAARLYYEDGKSQQEIASFFGVSRPLVSRLLTEARQRGIVEIRIHSPEEKRESLTAQMARAAGLAGCRLGDEGRDDKETNGLLAEETLALLSVLVPETVGIGWGHFIGELVASVETSPRKNSGIKSVCPLVGNAGIPIRFYQSNENVRLFAAGLGAAPEFLYLTALAGSMEEKQVLLSTGLYQQMEAQWAHMDAALVNIGNYPSTPDFASGARYGHLLQEQHACGRLLAYFYNEEGELIRSDHDFAIQIPLDILKNCPAVIGLCSANTSLRALRGALATGLFTHLIARERLAEAYLERKSRE